VSEFQAVEEKATRHELAGGLGDRLIDSVERNPGPGQALESSGPRPDSEVLQRCQRAREQEDNTGHQGDRLALPHVERAQRDRRDRNEEPVDRPGQAR